MTKNEDISNPFEGTERKTLAAKIIDDKNKYLTMLCFGEHYTHLDTCPQCHPYNYMIYVRVKKKMVNHSNTMSFKLKVELSDKG